MRTITRVIVTIVLIAFNGNTSHTNDNYNKRSSNSSSRRGSTDG